jgi:hypothetical protein
MTALRCASVWPVGVSSPSSPRNDPPSVRPIKMGESCGGTGDGETASGRSRGWAMFGASWCAMSACSPPLQPACIWRVPSWRGGGF